MFKLTLALVCVTLAAPLAAHAQAPASTPPAAPASSAAPSASPDVATPATPGTAELKPAPPTPIAIQKQELGDPQPWDPDWDTTIEQALPADLLSSGRDKQVRALCPRFQFLTDADKRAFWAYFFQALAGAEAGLQPTADVRHKDPAVAVVDPVTHRIARQEGLLQLAYMDSERYNCAFDWDRDKELAEHNPDKTILQPKENLLCGINILENQLVTRHKPVLSGTSYWVTLRPGTYSFQLFMKQMANVPEECGAPRVRRRWRPWPHRQRTPEAGNPSQSTPDASGQREAGGQVGAPAAAPAAAGAKAVSATGRGASR